MSRFTIRDVLWLMLLVAFFAAMYSQRQHLKEPPKIEVKTVEVTVNNDGTTTTTIPK